MFHITSCTSQNSTAIISSNIELPSNSAASSSSSSSSSSLSAGGRALDRHNPIITDERRSGVSSKPGTPIGTPRTNHILQQKPKTPLASPKPQDSPMISRKKKGNKPVKMNKNTTKRNVAARPSLSVNDDNQQSARKSFSLPSELIMKAAACNNSRPGVDYISPPESSRYLLDDTSFLDVLSDFDPVMKLAPYKSNHAEVVSKTADASSKSPKPPSSSSGSSDQVVVLRVSLHCRGCEKKMKKHLSRLAGVTSFSIDFTAKKVTVIGDVTPLGVLASISKVKTAKLWAPALPSSSQVKSRNVEARK